MAFEQEYFDKIISFFKSNKGKTVEVKNLTKDPLKLTLHVKKYIDSRHNITNYVDVSFNNEYTKIKIHEKI